MLIKYTTQKSALFASSSFTQHFLLFYSISLTIFVNVITNQKSQMVVSMADEDADVSETEPDKGKQADIPAFFAFTFPTALGHDFGPPGSGSVSQPDPGSFPILVKVLSGLKIYL